LGYIGPQAGVNAIEERRLISLEKKHVRCVLKFHSGSTTYTTTKGHSTSRLHEAYKFDESEAVLEWERENELHKAFLENGFLK